MARAAGARTSPSASNGKRVCRRHVARQGARRLRPNLLGLLEAGAHALGTIRRHGAPPRSRCGPCRAARRSNRCRDRAAARSGPCRPSAIHALGRDPGGALAGAVCVIIGGDDDGRWPAAVAAASSRSMPPALKRSPAGPAHHELDAGGGLDTLGYDRAARPRGPPRDGQHRRRSGRATGADCGTRPSPHHPSAATSCEPRPVRTRRARPKRSSPAGCRLRDGAASSATHGLSPGSAVPGHAIASTARRTVPGATGSVSCRQKSSASAMRFCRLRSSAARWRSISAGSGAVCRAVILKQPEPAQLGEHVVT